MQKETLNDNCVKRISDEMSKRFKAMSFDDRINVIRNNDVIKLYNTVVKEFGASCSNGEIQQILKAFDRNCIGEITNAAAAVFEECGGQYDSH